MFDISQLLLSVLLLSEYAKGYRNKVSLATSITRTLIVAEEGSLMDSEKSFSDLSHAIDILQGYNAECRVYIQCI